MVSMFPQSGGCAADAGFPALELQEVEPLLSMEDPSHDLPRRPDATQEPPLDFIQNCSIRSDIKARAKMKASKVKRVLDKLAVDSEPGLSSAQLMLANHDLKPGNKQRSPNLADEKDLYSSSRFQQSNRNADNGEHGTLLVFGSPTPSISTPG